MTFAVAALEFPNQNFRTPASTQVSFIRDTGIDLAFAGATVGLVLFVLWANFLITAWSNAVNLTDGLDGLATGRLAHRLRRLRHRLRVAVEPELPVDLHGRPALLRDARPARPRGGRRRDHRGVLRVPLVEREPGEDLHGRHRVARPRRRAGRPVDPLPHRDPRRDHRRALRARRALRRHPDRVLQDDRQAGVQDGPAAPPLRAAPDGARSPSSSGSGSSPVSSSPPGSASTTPSGSRADGRRRPHPGLGALRAGRSTGPRRGLRRVRTGCGRRPARARRPGARPSTRSDPEADVADAGGLPGRPVGLDDVDLLVASPGWAPTTPLLAAATRPRPAGVERGRARLAAARRPDARPRRRRPRSGAVARGDRHERQDDDRRHARVDPHRGRPAHPRGRQRRRRPPSRPRPTRTSTCSRSSCRASSSTSRTRCHRRRRRASTSPPTTSTGTAPSRRTRPPRAASTSAPRSPASTTPPTR